MRHLQFSVSENCKWRIRQKFQQGIPTTAPLTGYRIHKGEFTIEPAQAAITRMIFEDYAAGMGRNAIRRKLLGMGVRSLFGGEWSDADLRELLCNEKYVGDVVMQKYFRDDHMAKKDRRNNGELDRYAVCEHHKPIVDRETFERVQQRMREQKERFTPPRGQTSPFTGMIYCPLCGKNYRRKTTHGKRSWQCGTFLALGKAYCHTKQIPEDTLMSITASVLGIAEFDGYAFHRLIERIEVPAFNHLVYIFKDGRREERIWQDRSRRDSWTDEMKEQAAEHAKRRNRK